MPQSDLPVAVIGGGWAGCATAVTLSRLGHRVHLCEAAPVLGGRARRVERAGLALDNGQHLLLGAYREVLDLIKAVHGEDALATLIPRRPLSMLPADPAQKDALALRGSVLPAPFGLAASLLGAGGLTLRDRLGTIAWYRRLLRAGFRCPADETVAGMLESGPPRAARLLWNPLCLAALNTPPERASAQVFANVLRSTFAGHANDAHMLVPAVDLSTLFPDAARQFVEGHGGKVECGARTVVQAIEREHVTLRTGNSSWRARCVVVAVGPHQLRVAFDRGLATGASEISHALASIDGLRYEPIVTVWLGYASAVTVRATPVRLDDAPGQWAFDRGDILRRATGGDSQGIEQLFAVVISAAGAHARIDHPTLQSQCDAQLRRLVPGLPMCTFAQTIAERRATYACEPGRARLASAQIGARLFLAGDYMDAEFPPTLEAAARSGVRTANAVHTTRWGT